MSNFQRLSERLEPLQQALRDEGLAGWLLYDLHARNTVAASLLGLGDLTRRYFVYIPGEGDPTAVIHGIEQTPWADWPWTRRSYVGWRELHEVLDAVLGDGRVAMEVSERDAVPAVDLVPAGVVELVEAAGATVTSSSNLITRFHARWSPEGLESHHRTSRALAEVARAAFDHIGDAVRSGRPLREGEVRQWILDRLDARACGVGAAAIVANTVNAADPHYDPGSAGAELTAGDLVLIDLWSKESEQSIYADQTWMAYLGDRVPDRFREVWAAIRDARDAAVGFLQERWAGGRPVQGYEVDDVARGVIEQRGFGPFFIHRTGHSIDQSTHGMGPNIDNLETHESRELIPGVGFSIEPGIYMPGEVGMRTEINVYMTEDGPEVTTPEMQSEIFTLLKSE